MGEINLSKHIDLVLEQGSSLIDFYRENPSIAAYDLLGVDLAPIQRVVFDAMWKKPYVLAICTRGMGKSVHTKSLVLVKNKGLLYLDEILPKIPKFLPPGTDTVIDYKKPIYTNEGFCFTKKAALEHKIPGKKIITSLGCVHKGSNHHKLLTSFIDNRYDTTGTMKEGSFVCIQYGQNVFGNNVFAYNDSYYLGQQLKLGDTYTYFNNSKILRTSNRSTILFFLLGLFKNSDTLKLDRDVVINNKAILFEIQLMLLNLGILSCIDGNMLSVITDIVLFEQIIYGYKTTTLSYFYDKVVSIEDWEGDCYDFEMDCKTGIEPNYFANGFINHNTFLSGVLAALLALLYPGYRVGLIGPSFRQSKMIFSEVEKLYEQSSILREATVKRPIRGSDTCYLKFKSVAGHHGSLIESLPIGTDGSKIRGSRFYCLLIDEFAQVPEVIIKNVLAPMSITKLDPMKRVRELERRERLIKAGLATPEDFEGEDMVNKMIGTSSGYYKFNHMYKRMREYWDLIEEGSEDHAVFQVPYTLLPEGFLEQKNVENARRSMSDHEFRMEYMGEMTSDTDGFFKASLMDLCTVGNRFNVESSGDASSRYIVGADPNQGGRADCGVVILKLVGNTAQTVRVLALEGKTTQGIVTSLQDICERFNVERLLLDRGGGGKAVADLLEEGYNNKEPILDRSKKENLRKEGKHILELVTFNTSWISDANYITLSFLEDKRVLFPEAPVNSVSDAEAEAYDLVNELKKQCANIVVTQTAGGALHFDTPKRDQKKDLYSAFILACYGVKALELEDTVDDNTVKPVSTGLVRNHGDSTWGGVGNSNVMSDVLSNAVLKPRK